MSAPRTILHCDMDAFYAAIEQRDRPELRGRPVIVGHAGKRGVVSTASYEARKFGVHSAMPSSVAKRLCPAGIWVAPRMEVYAGVSRQVFEVFESMTPLVEGLSLDEAFLDVTASELLLGGGEAIARRIQERVFAETGLGVSVGVAACKFVAKVASDLRKPRGIVVVPPGGEPEFLAPLPVARLWGAGKVSQRTFAALGLRTIGDVQRLDRAALVRAFGEAGGAHYFALCRGDDARDVEPDRDAKSIGRETTFGDDVVDDVRLDSILLQLCESVGSRLRRAGLRGSVVRLKLRFPPFETVSRQRALERPTHDDLVIYRVAAALLGAARAPGTPVRLVGVTVGDLLEGPAAVQRGLFESPETSQRAERVLGAIDAIRGKFGKGAIRRAGGPIDGEGR